MTDDTHADGRCPFGGGRIRGFTPVGPDRVQLNPCGCTVSDEPLAGIVAAPAAGTTTDTHRVGLRPDGGDDPRTTGGEGS